MRFTVYTNLNIACMSTNAPFNFLSSTKYYTSFISQSRRELAVTAQETEREFELLGFKSWHALEYVSFC